METINKLIAIYARVSTANQEEEGTVQNQLIQLHEYAEKHGYKIVEEYIDEGWSGSILQRPALDRLRNDARGASWKSVLIYDPDRLARKGNYQTLVMDELEEIGVEVLFITTPTAKDGSDRMMFGLKGLFAEYERTRIAERFRLGKIRKLRDGHVLLSEPPYGYSYTKRKGSTHGYLEIREDEANVVRTIFNWIAIDKLTLRYVVRKLHKLGIAPRKSKRGVWNTSTLSTMLRNEVYIGKARWGSSTAIIPVKPLKDVKYKKVKKTSRKIRPREEWEMNIVEVPAIIEKSVFEAVGKQLKTNFQLCKRNRKNKYLLPNLLRCTCGKTRTGEGSSKNKDYKYYRCTDRVSSYPLPRSCFEGGINAEVADNLVWDKISKLMTSPALLAKQLERWLKERSKKSAGGLGDPEILTQQIVKLKEQVVRHDHAYGAGVYTLEQLKTYTTPIREQISTLTSTLNEMQQQAREQEIANPPTQMDIVKFSNRVREGINNLNFSQKRDIVVSVIERIVANQKEMTVYGYIPVNNVNNYVEFKSISRNCRTP